MPRPLTVLRRRDARVAAIGLLVLAVFLVVLVSGGDDDRAELERGTPAFPLRGELAGDDDLLAQAADAWIEDDRQDDEDDRVFDDDEREVTVLWAGRRGGETTVVAAHRLTVALLTRRDSGRASWRVTTTPLRRRARERSVIAFPNAVLLPERVDATFRPADPQASRIVDLDGLRVAEGGSGTSEFEDGALLLPYGVGAALDREPTVVITGDRPLVRRVSPDLLRRLEDREFDLPAMQRFVRAAADGATRSGTDAERRAFSPSTLDFVTDERLPGIGPTMVLTLATGRRTRPVAATGGSAVAGTDGAVPIDLGPPEDGTSGSPRGVRDAAGPGLASAYVVRVRRPGDDPDTTTDDEDDALDVVTGPFLLVAGGTGVAQIEVRVGSRRIVRRGPVAVLDADRARPADDPSRRSLVRRDVSVLGTTPAGRVVVPDGLPAGLTRVQPD